MKDGLAGHTSTVANNRHRLANENLLAAEKNSTNLLFSREKSLPVLGRAQGGEDGNLVIGDSPIDWTYRPADLQNVQDAFAVFVTGDSMVPKYKNQDIAYIHPGKTPSTGRFVLIETDDHSGFIKQFIGWRRDTLLVKQFNPEKLLSFSREKVKSVLLVIGSMDAG